MSQRSGNNSGRFYGKYRGIVSNITDPNKMGRIKFTCPTVFGTNDTESAWALPCTNCAYDGGGDIALPRIGETVWVEFEEGNPNKPIWVGNFWTQDNTPFGAGGTSDSGVGEDYGNEARVINYNGTTIVMKNGVCRITNGGCTLTMKGGEATLSGNLTVTGNVTVQGNANVSKKTTSGSVSAGSILATRSLDKEGEVIAGSGEITAEETMYAKNLEVEETVKIEQTLEVTEDVTIEGKLDVTGDTTLKKLKVEEVDAAKCSLV